MVALLSIATILITGAFVTLVTCISIQIIGESVGEIQRFIRSIVKRGKKHGGSKNK